MRPMINEHAMTPAERMRRHRASKRDALPKGKTRRQIAHEVGASERYVYFMVRYDRFKSFDWDAAVLNGKYGRCGMSFVAEVCALARPEAQRQIHDMIIECGAKFARRVWRESLRVTREQAARVDGDIDAISTAQPQVCPQVRQ